MNRNWSLFVAVLLIAGCSSKPYTGQTTTATSDSGLQVITTETRTMLPGRVLAGSESELRRFTAKVLSTNSETRQIALRTADNKTQFLTAGPEVRNFAQIKAGDRVTIEYWANLKFEVRPPTEAEMTRAQSASAFLATAPLGAKPAGIMGIGDIGVFSVNEVNKAASTVTLTSANGSFVFKSKHPENLDFVHRGDNVVVEVAELLAARVSPQS